jgi:S1-C subfamily serine protease
MKTRNSIALAVSLISLLVLTSCSSLTNSSTESMLNMDTTTGSQADDPETANQADGEMASQLEIGGTTLAEIYDRVYPGVVTIWTYSDVGDSDNTRPLGQGSGFVVDTDGHILTNQHVIEGASAIEVDFPSGLKSWAELIATDPNSDLAVLKVDIPQEGLFPLPLGDSDQVRVGDFVIAVGNPFNYEGTMTLGIVSSKGRTLESVNPAPGGSYFSAGDLIQTDAAINPGNSGGPLINLDGEVIGVNRAISTESFSAAGNPVNSGVGFAIPVNIVRRVLPDLISEGSYEYPYLGIQSLGEWNLRTIELLGLPADALGAYIKCVNDGSPADEAGLIGAGRCGDPAINPGGDLIIAIDNHPVSRFSELLSYLLKNTEVGQVVTLTVLRDGETIDLPLTIGARP